MNDAEYILLKRKKRLWPAKILSRICTSRARQGRKDGTTYCLVEILGLNKQARVHCKDVELLTEESINYIAAKLGQNSKGHNTVEELTYRRALREALDILQQAMPSIERSPSKTAGSRTATWKETKERAAGCWLRSSRNDMLKREGETGQVPTAIKAVGTQNECGHCARGKTKGSSSANLPRSTSTVLLRNRELKDQPQHASKAKMPSTPKKDVTLNSSSRPGVGRRSPHFSKGCERHHQDEMGRERRSPSSPSECFSRTSTPAHLSHDCAKSTPGKKPAGKLGFRRNLLGSPVKRPSAEAKNDPSEKEEFPSRKYSKDVDGERRPQDSKDTSQKQIPLCWESYHKGSAGNPDPVGPILDGIREESLYPCADEAKNFQLGDLDGNGLGFPPEPALRLSPPRELFLSSGFGDEEEVEDEEELPSILLHQEPCSMEAGMLVWCKFPRYPYWPAVVKSVKRKAKKASVQFIEKCMGEKSKGFGISLRNLKHFDCEEKQTLIDKASESYRDEINWCINLITDYRIRVGCHSFTGTFLEYCADDMSYPVRKETHLNLSEMTFPQIEEVDSTFPLIEEVDSVFPQIEEVDSEEPPFKATPRKPPKKVLPDRTRAARDRANKKIVEFIVKTQGADEHLRAILKSKKQSQWLKDFLKAPPYVNSIETYLEDDNQQARVVEYLQEVYRQVNAELPPLINGNSVEFILAVLFPEAIIYAISAVERIDYKKAEEKYKRGPLLSQREKEIFDEEILEKKRQQRLQQQLTHSPEESL